MARKYTLDDINRFVKALGRVVDFLEIDKRKQEPSIIFEKTMADSDRVGNHSIRVARYALTKSLGMLASAQQRQGQLMLASAYIRRELIRLTLKTAPNDIIPTEEEAKRLAEILGNKQNYYRMWNDKEIEANKWVEKFGVYSIRITPTGEVALGRYLLLKQQIRHMPEFKT